MLDMLVVVVARLWMAEILVHVIAEDESICFFATTLPQALAANPRKTSQDKETLLVRSWPRCRWSTPSVSNFAAAHARAGGCRCSRARSKQSHSLGFCPRAVVLTPAFKVVSPCRIEEGARRVRHYPPRPACHRVSAHQLWRAVARDLENKRKTVRFPETLRGTFVSKT